MRANSTEEVRVVESPALVSRIAGGLGNQLFCYAFSRNLSSKRNLPLYLDGFSAFQNCRFNQQYQLRHFRLNAPLLSRRLVRTTFLRRLLFSFLRRLEKSGFSTGRVVMEHRDKDKWTSYSPSYFEQKVRGITWVEGLWQSEKYFSEIESDLRKEFSIVKSVSDTSLQYLNEIESCNAVCLHARRLRSEANQKGAKPVNDESQLPWAYYEQAMTLVKERVQNPRFFCFSDFPRWFYEKTTGREDCTVVDLNDTQDGAIEDFRLMSACRHFINGNSTFSWWAAWLGEQTDSVVFSPPNDQLSKRYSYNRDLIPNRWNVLSPFKAS